MDTPPDPPPPPPEALLLERARKARRLTPAAAAKLAGVSVSLWRQYENGYDSPGKGIRVEKKAPADTYARMAYPLGITGAMIRKEAPLRGDAAEELDKLASSGPPPAAPAGTPPGQRRLPVLHQGVDENALAPYIRDVQALLLDAIDRCGPDPPGAEIFDDADEATWWDGARREISPGRPLLFRDERVRRTALERMKADEARRAG